MLVGFLYAVWQKEPSGLLFTSMSRQGRWPSDSVCMVNWMLGCILLKWQSVCLNLKSWSRMSRQQMGLTVWPGDCHFLEFLHEKSWHSQVTAVRLWQLHPFVRRTGRSGGKERNRKCGRQLWRCLHQIADSKRWRHPWSSPWWTARRQTWWWWTSGWTGQLWFRSNVISGSFFENGMSVDQCSNKIQALRAIFMMYLGLNSPTIWVMEQF